jgi:hypothetical protein
MEEIPWPFSFLWRVVFRSDGGKGWACRLARYDLVPETWIFYLGFLPRASHHIWYDISYTYIQLLNSIHLLLLLIHMLCMHMCDTKGIMCIARYPQIGTSPIQGQRDPALCHTFDNIISMLSSYHPRLQNC